VLERTASILVVDTNAAGRAEVIDPLFTAGYHVTAAASFDEAKARLTENPPDLLITEIRLGAFNGLQLVMRARVRHFIPAIVVTAFHDPVLEAEATRQRAGYLAKPLNIPDFLIAVARLLVKRTSSHDPSSTLLLAPYNQTSIYY
jgi:DNA-binding NtrC family response regulator